MKTKALVFCQLPPPVHGSNIMGQMFVASLQGLGHDVFVVEKAFSRHQKDIGRFSLKKILRVPMLGIEIIRTILRGKPTFCFYFISVSPISLVLDSLFLLIVACFRIPYALYFHGKGFSAYCSSGNLFFKYLVKTILSKSLGGIVLGESLKNDVNLIIPNNQLYVLPNSIPDTDLENDNFKRKGDGRIVVLFLSNLIPSKGPMEFLQMAKRVVEKYKNVKFVLAGPRRSDDFFSQLKDYIKNEGLTDFVEVPGGVYGTEKEKLFINSDIFVFPTYYDRETFGLVNLEAMQWGLPVISTQEGAIPDIVHDGINGFIVNPKDIDQLADRVLRLINSRDLRHKMGKAGREFYENLFTSEIYEKNVEKAVDFFYSLMSTQE